MSGDPIAAVTFDYWNTIVRADADQGAHRLRAWAVEYAEAGHLVDDDTLRAAFRAVWDEHQAAWSRNQQYTGERAARTAIEQLDLPVSEHVRDRLVERFLTAGEEAGFHLCDGVDALVTELHGRGVRLGIVCDVGFTPSSGLRRILERFGILDCFNGWSFSDEVGGTSRRRRSSSTRSGISAWIRTRPPTSVTCGGPTSWGPGRWA